MIDEKGKLFGKVNLVDLIIVLVILAAVAYLGMTFLGPESAVTSTETVKISFYGEEVPEYVVETIEAGTPVWDLTENVTIGSVNSWETGESISYVVSTAQSIAFETPKTGYNSIELEVDAEGVLEAHGVRIGGSLYGVGHSVTLYAGDAKMFLKVSGIEGIEG